MFPCVVKIYGSCAVYPRNGLSPSLNVNGLSLSQAKFIASYLRLADKLLLGETALLELILTTHRKITKTIFCIDVTIHLNSSVLARCHTN